MAEKVSAASISGTNVMASLAPPWGEGAPARLVIGIDLDVQAMTGLHAALTDALTAAGQAAEVAAK